MSSLSSFVLAQITNAAGTLPAAGAADQAQSPWWTGYVLMIPFIVMGYLLFIRPQSLAQKQQKETISAAKTGDKVIMTNGIHGFIANVKETTFVVKIADNVKIEVEKSAVDKVTRPAAEPAKAA